MERGLSAPRIGVSAAVQQHTSKLQWRDALVRCGTRLKEAAMNIQISYGQMTSHRHRVDKILAERGEGCVTSARVESWSVEAERVHACHLVAEFASEEAEARRGSRHVRGLLMSAGASSQEAGVGTESPWSAHRESDASAVDVTRRRDDGTCGLSVPFEPMRKGGQSG